MYLAGNAGKFPDLVIPVLKQFAISLWECLGLVLVQSDL